MNDEVVLDDDRINRVGIDEGVLCEGKSVEQIETIITTAQRVDRRLLLTRLTPNHFGQLANNIQTLLDYDSVSRTAILGEIRTPIGDSKVAIVSAGTSDVPIAREATRTLFYHGVSSTEIHDVGVAGLWRLQRRVSELSDYPIIIAVAGMDAALPTVLGGLVSGLLIGVPSSTGYGVSRKGESALASMLLSCAPGIAVTNIDNGFGAACIALRVLHAAALVGAASG